MTIVFVVAAFCMGAAIAAFAVYWLKTPQVKTRQMRSEWRIDLRALVNSKEQRAWLWLSKVMPEQQVLLKLPFARFTTAADKEDRSEHWYKQLNAVYCTFTITNSRGVVLGCIDVQDEKLTSESNQSLKRSLLLQVDIPYWVVDPNNFPLPVNIRTAFLGSQGVKDEQSNVLEARFKEKRQDRTGKADHYPHGKNRRMLKRNRQV